MADEDQQHEHDHDHDSETPEASTDEMPSDDDLDETADDEAAVADVDQGPPLMTFVANAVNQLQLGRLTLHYPQRDVTVLVDGDAALRVMSAHHRRRQAGLGDILDPAVSEARSGWLTLDPQEPLAISWMPGLPGQRPRMAIDPAGLPAG
jgi:hypothetical protein